VSKDWFGNIRMESASMKYLARLNGIQLSNCPYVEEKTLRDVLCKCPNLYVGSMNNCTFGGTPKSINMDASLRARYSRGDVLGTRGAVGDDIMKGQCYMCCSIELLLEPASPASHHRQLPVSQTAESATGRG